MEKAIYTRPLLEILACTNAECELFGKLNQGNLRAQGLWARAAQVVGGKRLPAGTSLKSRLWAKTPAPAVYTASMQQRAIATLDECYVRNKLT